ncbi:ribonuclease H [Trifolium pratense]|uniref:Ribonuclease H n=1 Tax=Trifolium pratense TaxID=57577 RepID=A0A2K3NJV5_TRIPR|nr:ribonuclease H [Trifolium pratense]
MKMPVSVWKQVVSIQREFLWGGVKGGNKIKWVKWSVVCKAKRRGGLGARDVRLVNLSLLAKWRWVDWSDFRIPTSASKWWKDICSLDKVVESNNWLVESVVRKVRNGNSTFFWTSKWIGEAPLAEGRGGGGPSRGVGNFSNGRKSLLFG